MHRRLGPTSALAGSRAVGRYATMSRPACQPTLEAVDFPPNLTDPERK